jgi:hypothetical protein
MVSTPSQPDRAALRLRSIAWALAAGVAALLLALGELPLLGTAWSGDGGLEGAVRAGGCGFFYGLLAFHLQRVDPDDSHLQAGLVGAVCGICSLISPLQVTGGPSTAMMGVLRGWLPLWLPLVGSALLLRGVHRLLPALRP